MRSPLHDDSAIFSVPEQPSQPSQPSNVDNGKPRFPAKYHSVCPICYDAIEPGQMITATPYGFDFGHVTCCSKGTVSYPMPEQPTPAPAQQPPLEGERCLRCGAPAKERLCKECVNRILWKLTPQECIELMAIAMEKCSYSLRQHELQVGKAHKRKGAAHA